MQSGLFPEETTVTRCDGLSSRRSSPKDGYKRVEAKNQSVLREGDADGEVSGNRAIGNISFAMRMILNDIWNTSITTLSNMDLWNALEIGHSPLSIGGSGSEPIIRIGVVAVAMHRYSDSTTLKEPRWNEDDYERIGAHRAPYERIGAHRAPYERIGAHRAPYERIGAHRAPYERIGAHRAPYERIGAHRAPYERIGAHRAPYERIGAHRAPYERIGAHRAPYKRITKE